MSSATMATPPDVNMTKLSMASDLSSQKEVVDLFLETIQWYQVQQGDKGLFWFLLESNHWQRIS